MQTSSVENVFARSWSLLTSNWVLIVPGLVIGIIVGIITALLTAGSATDPTTGEVNVAAAVGRGFGALIASLIAFVGIIANIAYTTGMAGAAWVTGRTSLADGSRAFSRDAGNVIGAFLLLIVIGIIAVLLSIPTLGLAMLAFFLLTIYTMPSAVVGENSGPRAIGESYRIATKRFVPTIIIVLVLFVVYIVAGIIGAALHFAPFIGPLVSTIITEIVAAYATLVITGEYLTLRDAGTLPTSAA